MLFSNPFFDQPVFFGNTDNTLPVCIFSQLYVSSIRDLKIDFSSGLMGLAFKKIRMLAFFRKKSDLNS